MARTNGDDIRPVGNIVLMTSTVLFKTFVFNLFDIFRSDYGAVSFQTYGIIITGADGNDVRPAGDIALTGIIVSGGDDCAVCPQPECIFRASADRSFKDLYHPATGNFIVSPERARSKYIALVTAVPSAFKPRF